MTDRPDSGRKVEEFVSMIEKLIETIDPEVDPEATERMEYPGAIAIDDDPTPNDARTKDQADTESGALAFSQRPPISRSGDEKGPSILEGPTDDQRQRSKTTDTARPKTPGTRISSKEASARAETRAVRPPPQPTPQPGRTRPPPPPPVSHVPIKNNMEAASLNFESDFELLDQSLIDTEKMEDSALRRRSNSRVR